MDKLKPCPFCGGKAVMISEPIAHDRFLVACKNRGDMCKCEPCTNWFATREEAAEAWNRRVNDASVRHGAWYLLDDCANAGLYCSACSKRVHREEFAYKKLRSKYCPHCGALMDGGAEDG